MRLFDKDPAFLCDPVFFTAYRVVNLLYEDELSG